MARSIAGLVLLYSVISYREAFPIKMFKYMSVGIPVIASDFSLWKELVEETDCGICVDPHNSKEIAKVIRWVIEHPIEAKRMGDNRMKEVKERYN